MHNHEPENYVCPFCGIINRVKDTIEDSEVVYQNETVTAFLGLDRWEKNPVDVLVVPNRRIENLYDLPVEFALALQQVTRAVALALKGLTRCEGVSTRQHNEPAGGQDVWHYHVHITPRFEDDQLYAGRKVPFPEVERLAAAKQLREFLKQNRQLLR